MVRNSTVTKYNNRFYPMDSFKNYKTPSGYNSKHLKKSRNYNSQNIVSIAMTMLIQIVRSIIRQVPEDD